MSKYSPFPFLSHLSPLQRIQAIALSVFIGGMLGAAFPVSLLTYCSWGALTVFAGAVLATSRRTSPPGPKSEMGPRPPASRPAARPRAAETPHVKMTLEVSPERVTRTADLSV